MGLCVRTVLMSDVVDNSSLRNETKCLLREARVEHGATSHNCNQSNLKVKEEVIAVQKSSINHRHDNLS